jgi:hypothetical protein
VNREKASELGVTVADVARTLQLALSGQRMGYFIMDGKQYQVIGQLQREDRNKPNDLKNIYVRSRSGNMVSLDNLITFRKAPVRQQYIVSTGMLPPRSPQAFRQVHHSVKVLQPWMKLRQRYYRKPSLLH